VRDEEAGLVAYAAGGVLVDGGLASRRARISPDRAWPGQRARLVEVSPRSQAAISQARVFKRNGAVCRAGDEEADLAAVQCAASRFCGSGRWCAEAPDGLLCGAEAEVGITKPSLEW